MAKPHVSDFLSVDDAEEIAELSAQERREYAAEAITDAFARLATAHAALEDDPRLRGIRGSLAAAVGQAAGGRSGLIAAAKKPEAGFVNSKPARRESFAEALVEVE